MRRIYHFLIQLYYTHFFIESMFDKIFGKLKEWGGWDWGVRFPVPSSIKLSSLNLIKAIMRRSIALLLLRFWEL